LDVSKSLERRGLARGRPALPRGIGVAHSSA
jgi:hypothetical protein